MSTSAYKQQPWMGSAVRKDRWDTHDEAMETILSAATVTALSYEEAALIYARARGFIVDDADLMGQPPAA